MKKENYGQFTNMWKLSNTLLNNQCVEKEIKIGKYIEINKIQNILYQNLWNRAKSSTKREVCYNIFISKRKKKDLKSPT